MKNWAGNVEYSTQAVHYPQTLDELMVLVQQLAKCRVLGSRHSFNNIADSTENLISLERFAPTIIVDSAQRRVTISGNIRYGDLCPVLHQHGYGLHNMASLPHISVAGACATATHGSGVRNQNLASAMIGLEIVTANGDLICLSKENDGGQLYGAVVNLGGLGIVTKMTLALESAYEMQQNVYLNLPIQALENHFDEIMLSAYSVSLFTNWQPTYIAQVWLKQRITDPIQSDFFGATPAMRRMHPIAELPADSCTEQLGIVGHWHERLPHFRIDATPSAGDELQSEYFVPREQAVAAMRAVQNLYEHIAPHLLISEIRTIAADNFWMSPCYHQDSVGIHFTWKPDWAAVKTVLPLIEAALIPFGVRPHWGKLFTMSPHLIRSHYEKLPDFQQLLRQFDPDGKFRNAYLDSILDG